MRATLARAEAAQARFNCFITLCPERALAEAAAADRVLAPRRRARAASRRAVSRQGSRQYGGRAHHFCLLDARTQCAGARTAVSVARLRRAGAILIGKTTTPEFGHMPYTEAPLFGRTRNVWSAERTCGGSSGGAAVAVAAGVAPLAVATDAGGSTRIPAACNGVIGFKQSAGLIPHDMSPELFANVSSINPMTRTVADCALMLETMAGEHPLDPYSYGAPARGFIAAAQAGGQPQGPARRLATADGQ